MDEAQQGHIVDTSLAYLQKLQGEMRVLSSTPDFSGTASKRKRLGSSSEDKASKKTKATSVGQNSAVPVPAKFPRHDRSRQLPAELWHRIFSFIPPVALGRLLRVNRMFHKYLDPASPFVISTPVIHVPTTRILPTLSPDSIWRSSRRLHWPTMPAPLKGRLELDMWRFACTRSCQLCGQRDGSYKTPEASLQRCGPGNTTVSPIFSFFINSCGDCLAETSIKEVDLLLSTSSPSFILPGLSMIFMTPDMNIITPQAMRSTPVPPTLQLTKVYWPAQVDKLREEFEEIRVFGTATGEEWIKGLDGRGVEAIHDASRWDQWFQMGGVRQMRVYSTQPTPTTKKTRRLDKKGPVIGKPLQKPRQDVETAVRLHISNLADEVIRDRWLKGRSVKKENCIDFVMEVLTYIRKQFYKDEAVSKTRKLTLDDMRWIFDSKIAPHTCLLQKEFFLCRECPKPKRYGFQAVAQHYAMKHGSKKMKAMLWRSEWPEKPPFRPPMEHKATDTAPDPTMHRSLDDSFAYAGSNMTDEQPRHSTDNFRTERINARLSRRALKKMRAQHIVREPDESRNPTLGPIHLGSSVGSSHEAPAPRRDLGSYYLRREHAPYSHMTESPYPDVESQRERRHAEVEARHTSRRPYVSGYGQPMPSTTLYRLYDVFGVRSQTNDQYIDRSAISNEYRAPSNANYPYYANWEQYDNTASVSRVYNAYDSRDLWSI